MDDERPATAYNETETGPTGPVAGEDSPEPDREAHSEPGVPEPREDAEEGAGEAQEGILVGTESEQAPGVGRADHPAPAAVRDPETGRVRVHGEPPAGWSAGTQAPVGDSFDEQSGDVDAEARERLNAVTEPEPIDTERPDIGTE